MASEPVCIADFENHAKTFLPKNAWDYFRSGANDEMTLRENRLAFDRLRLRPQVLRDVADIDTSTTILGEKIDFPICVAPTGLQKMAHPHGELATAKAANEAGTCMILSTFSTTSIEDVAQVSSGLKWFQLYVLKDKEITKNLIERAERAGYKAIAVTVDTPYLGKYAHFRYPVMLPPHLTVANISDSGMAIWDELVDLSLTWDFISWLRSVTKLPIVLKGILTEEDAKLAVQYGVDGILVSNHGGRQLDGVPATIETLPEICHAVGDKCEVYLDGGVRFGSDAFKALALGARAVFVGRPVLWGLSYQGKHGVSQVLQIFKDELKLAMGLAGCSSLEDISKNMVTHHTQYSKL